MISPSADGSHGSYAELVRDVLETQDKHNFMPINDRTIIAFNRGDPETRKASFDVRVATHHPDHADRSLACTGETDTFALGAGALLAVKDGAANQVIAANGTSGAGKTFTLRELLFFLTLADDWAPGNGSYTKQDAPDKAVPLHARIQDLLELGEGMMSCATTENRSSTRSTTIVEVEYDSIKKTPIGARITVLGLERWRFAVDGTSGEAYNMRALQALSRGHGALRLLKYNALSLPMAHLALDKSFTTVNQSTSVEDEEAYLERHVDLLLRLFDTKEVCDILRIMGAMLHLGNIDRADKEDASGAYSRVESLLGMPAGTLRSLLDTQGPGVARTEASWYHARDSIIGVLGERLMSTIVYRGNSHIASGATDKLVISVLDRMGAEALKENTLSQLITNKNDDHISDLCRVQSQRRWDDGEEAASTKPPFDALARATKACKFLNDIAKPVVVDSGRDDARYSVAISQLAANRSLALGFKLVHPFGEVKYTTKSSIAENLAMAFPDLVDLINTSTLGVWNEPVKKRTEIWHDTATSRAKAICDRVERMLESAEKVYNIYCFAVRSGAVGGSPDHNTLKDQLRAGGLLGAIDNDEFDNSMSLPEFQAKFPELLQGTHKVTTQRVKQLFARAEQKYSVQLRDYLVTEDRVEYNHRALQALNMWRREVKSVASDIASKVVTSAPALNDVVYLPGAHAAATYRPSNRTEVARLAQETKRLELEVQKRDSQYDALRATHSREMGDIATSHKRQKRKAGELHSRLEAGRNEVSTRLAVIEEHLLDAVRHIIGDINFRGLQVDDAVDAAINVRARFLAEKVHELALGLMETERIEKVCKTAVRDVFEKGDAIWQQLPLLVVLDTWAEGRMNSGQAGAGGAATRAPGWVAPLVRQCERWLPGHISLQMTRWLFGDEVVGGGVASEVSADEIFRPLEPVRVLARHLNARGGGGAGGDALFQRTMDGYLDAMCDQTDQLERVKVCEIGDAVRDMFGLDRDIIKIRAAKHAVGSEM